MSIATELNTLRTNLTSAYSAISSKGGTVPTDKNTANLSTAINSIPQTINSGTNTVSYVAFQMWPGMGKRDNIPSQYQQLEYLELNNYEQYCAFSYNGNISAATGMSRYRLLDFVIWLPEYAPMSIEDPNYNMEQANQYQKDRSPFWLFSPDTNSTTNNTGTGIGYKISRNEMKMIKSTYQGGSNDNEIYTYSQQLPQEYFTNGKIIASNLPTMRYCRMNMYDVTPALCMMQIDGFRYIQPQRREIGIQTQGALTGSLDMRNTYRRFTTPGVWLGKKFLVTSSNPAQDQQWDVHCPCRIYNIKTTQDTWNVAVSTDARKQLNLIDFVPVRRISDNKTGFLNVANGWNYFIPSAGTSDFTAGPDLV